MNDIYLKSFEQILKEDTVLCLENKSISSSIEIDLNKLFKCVLTCEDTQEAMKLLIQNDIDILIVDINESNSENIIKMVNSIKGFSPYLPIMIRTQSSAIQSQLDVLEFSFSHIIMTHVKGKQLLHDINNVYHNINMVAKK